MAKKKSPQVAQVPDKKAKKEPQGSFRASVLRGLAVALPPLLTVVIFLWVGATVRQYVLSPVESAAQTVIRWSIADVREKGEVAEAEAADFHTLPSGESIPAEVHTYVMDDVNNAREIWSEAGGNEEAKPLYNAYIQARFLRPVVVVPVFLAAFLAAMYFLGAFLAAGIGRAMWLLFERGVLSLPLVKNVYGSVKQVTDFMLSERELEFNRVVAVQYPRKGIWSLGFVTARVCSTFTPRPTNRCCRF